MKTLIFVRVGNDHRPASDENVKDVEKHVRDAMIGDGIFVTHHAVDISVVHIPEEDSGIVIKSKKYVATKRKNSR